jgi:hypothetical protein
MSTANLESELQSGHLEHEYFYAREARSEAIELDQERLAHCEPVPMDVDHEWLEILQRYKEKVERESSIQFRMQRLDERDPRCLELEAARRRMLISRLKASYADRNETYIWAILVFLISGFILIPLLGIPWGSAFSALTTLAWTVVHRIRRV